MLSAKYEAMAATVFNLNSCKKYATSMLESMENDTSLLEQDKLEINLMRKCLQDGMDSIIRRIKQV